MDFVIDTAGDEELLDKTEIIGEENERDFANANEKKLSSLLNKIRHSCNKFVKEEKKELEIITKINGFKTEELFNKFFLDMGWTKDPQYGMDSKPSMKITKNGLERFTNISLETGKFKIKAAQVDLAETLKKTVLTPGIEKEHSLPEYDVSSKRQRAARKAERDKTKGPQWYNIPAPEITEELKTDLHLLKMRSVMDPKHFYKKNDIEVLPKYFQVGTVMDSPLDHQNERLTRKERKRTFVDEMLADAEFNRYNKRKYAEIIEEKQKSTYKTYIKAKRLKSKQMHKQRKAKGEVQKNKKKRYY